MNLALVVIGYTVPMGGAKGICLKIYILAM
jgi:hypothetical protein